MITMIRSLVVVLLLAVATADTVFFLKHRQQQVDQLLHELEIRSDPANRLYGDWLSKGTVEEILSPDLHHREALRQWLRERDAEWEELGDKFVAKGLIEGDLGEAAVAVDLVVSTARNASFRFTPRTTRSPLPKRVTVAATAQDLQHCLAEQVDPKCLRSAYGIDVSASTKTGQAVIVDQGYKRSDLASFEKTFGEPFQGVVQDVGRNDNEAGDEASLDLQYIMTTGRGVPTTWVYLDGSMQNPFTNWLVWAAKTPDAEMPKVHSLSLGAPEDAVGDAVMKRMNTEMAALTARGVTIVFASGDAGYKRQMNFGAASPYVLSVGGVFNGDLGDEPLKVDPITTGGFSASPENKAGKWQAAAIQHFLSTKGRRPKKIDATQRAVPDISAYDSGFEIIQDGSQTPIGGTSAAAPVVAGMLASINDALVAGGHSTLGFVNPFLYSQEPAFLDVTKGDNGFLGFAAVEGYDPVSGLGTFSPSTFGTLRTAALKAAARAQGLRMMNQSHQEIVV